MDKVKRILGLDVPTSYAPLTIMMLIALVAIIVAAIVAVVLGAEWLTVSGYVVLALLIVGPILALAIWSTRGQAARVRAMITTDSLARWHYTPNEMAYFTQSETEQAQKNLKNVTLFVLITVLIAGIIGLIVFHSVTGFLFGASALLLAGVFVILKALTPGNPWVYPAKNKPDVLIGKAGVYQLGRFASFALLTNVVYQNSDPAFLLFDVAGSLSGTSAMQAHIGGGLVSTSTVQIRIGIPHGCEEEAQELVTTFKALLSGSKDVKMAR